ncbi:hypothetical protein I6F35_02650 [Bradyrhizobium sp. BRP22]|uniref:hypothetical protein n=1 Tax=Bradyrhizobium sp. BRP22 TaxID=2793821 RepID=UPI001CD2EE94|nr:hypothetical protein [Bradyrhizobium sp. BRP22]MCA1452113.1 hypothetical protein [Bradyrhizobium sp. BRP22]
MSAKERYELSRALSRVNAKLEIINRSLVTLADFKKSREATRLAVLEAERKNQKEEKASAKIAARS